MRITRISAAIFFAAAALAWAPPAAFADEADKSEGESEDKSEQPAAMTEEEKIEALIAVVEGLEGATFIRNGDEHDCAAAAKHMRRKWNAGKDDIETARDFIRLAASKSSITGEKYLIRFDDGTEQTSEDFLNAELDKLEKPAEEAQKGEEDETKEGEEK